MGKNASLTKEQRSRLLENIESQVDELHAQNRERIKYANEMGLGVNVPMVQLSSMVQALVGWIAPSEYQRARFMLDVERAIENALSDDSLGIAKERIDKEAEERAKLEREIALAGRGVRESGLLVPESAATPAVVLGEAGQLHVVPEPPDKGADQTIRPPASPASPLAPPAR